MAYLYGASIQGIQGFIFETNKLKEIIGASDIIEHICSLGYLKDILPDEKIANVLRIAGGNIRIKFDDEDRLKAFVRIFPQKVMREAYGIVISQAVVEYTEDTYLDKSDELERKLQSARNKTSYSLDAKFALMRQAKRTGKPAYKKKSRDEYQDKASAQKDDAREVAWAGMLLDKMGQKDKAHNTNFTLDMNKMSNNKNKIAVIHADGNKMGLKLQDMKKELQGKDAAFIQGAYKELSAQITKATNEAVQEAFESVFEKDIETSIQDEKKKIPFRPCIIGGDDVTVICDADSALDFSKSYLKLFENKTKTHFTKLEEEYGVAMFRDGLTACAGIAYCNEKFPFHYAVSLAEVLCGRAKEASGREASCLLFHNIQGSAFTDFNRYVEHELTLGTGDQKTSLEFGPYYVDPDKGASIDGLKNVHNLMSQKGFPLGKLREWLSELALNDDYAAKYLERFNVIAKRDKNINVKEIDEALKELGDLSLDRLIDSNHKTPIHDILQLKSVQGGKK